LGEFKITMKKLYMSVLVVVICVSAAFVGYGVYLNEASDRKIAEMMARNTITLRGVRAEYRLINPEVPFGNINFYSDMVADEIAQIGGFVKRVWVTRGQWIEKGAKLCELQNQDLPLQIARANTDVAKAEALYLDAKLALERDQRLFSKNAVAKAERDNSETKLKAALAELSAAKIQRDQLELQKKEQTVTASISGNVLMIYQNAGSYVQVGAPLALIGDFSTLKARNTITDDDMRNLTENGRSEEKYAFFVPADQRTNMGFLIDRKSGHGQDALLPVKIVDVSPPMREKALLRNVTLEANNSDGVAEPGFYDVLTLRSLEARRALCVPREVLKENAGFHAIYAEENGVLVSREVTTGVYDRDYIEVLKGLNEGDVIAGPDVSDLLLGAKVKVVPYE
jgi:RND family efflux transporter MFP subunit